VELEGCFLWGLGLGGGGLYSGGWWLVSVPKRKKMSDWVLQYHDGDGFFRKSKTQNGIKAETELK
jgi:hypothetical protein